MRIICPQCQGKLSIHRPSVAATRIKCRNCGHKFYAGKAEELGEANPVASEHVSSSDEATAEPRVVVVTAPADTAFDQDLKAEQRASTRERVREKARQKRVKWLVPIAVVCLLGMIVMSVLFAQRSHQIPSPPTSSLFDASKKKNKFESFGQAPPADSGALIIDVNGVTRPAELVGAWNLQEAGGGVLELNADGTAMLKGAFINDTLLELKTQWFVIKVDGKEYWVDFGPEPYRNQNYVATVRLLTEDSLRLIGFRSAAGNNFNPRMLKKGT
jgi:hypothetical protein